MMELYKNIREKRLALNMSQQELADKTGYNDRSSITRIEKGEIDLPQSKIVAFAEALNTTPGELMGWDAPEQLPNGWARVSAQDLSKAMVAQVAENGVAYGKLAPKKKTLADRFLAYIDKLNKLDADDLEEINQIIDMKLAKSKYQN